MPKQKQLGYSHKESQVPKAPASLPTTPTGGRNDDPTTKKPKHLEVALGSIVDHVENPDATTALRSLRGWALP